MMNRIDELLEKYYAGNSSLLEEKELKTYFNSGNINAKYEKYSPIFRAIENEKSVSSPQKEAYTIKRIPFRRRALYAVSGVAAACLLVLSVVRFQGSQDDYMILNGKRINDSEKAREYANGKLEKSLGVIHRSLEAYKDNAAVTERLNEIESQLK